jgi:hypothetical protein
MYDRRKSRLGPLAGASGTAIVLALAAATGHAASDSRGEYELRLTTRVPDAATGLSFRVGYRNPSDPNGKPPPITAATFELPSGTRIDGGALPVCRASDADFRARGRDACAPASRVGTGTLIAITGFGPPLDPVETDVTVFNGGDELVEVVFAKGTNTVLGLDRLKVQGSTLVANPPATPGGPPDGRTAIRRIALDIPMRRGGSGRPFVTAPDACPANGRWRSRARFGFADGGATTLTSETPCVARARKRRPAAALTVRPRRVRAFQRVRFRFRARGACGRRATVRLAGRRVRTNRRGRASLWLRLGRTGRRPARLGKRGCAPSRAFVRVLRR